MCRNSRLYISDSFLSFLRKDIHDTTAFLLAASSVTRYCAISFCSGVNIRTAPRYFVFLNHGAQRILCLYSFVTQLLSLS